MTKGKTQARREQCEAKRALRHVFIHENWVRCVWRGLIQAMEWHGVELHQRRTQNKLSSRGWGYSTARGCYWWSETYDWLDPEDIQQTTAHVSWTQWSRLSVLGKVSDCPEDDLGTRARLQVSPDSTDGLRQSDETHFLSDARTECQP